MNNIETEGTITSFPSRLKQAIGEKSARSFALQSGLSPTVMHQYLSGKSEPSRLALIAIANAAKVNLVWLMTGEGPMLKSRGRILADRELYDSIIFAVEEFLTEKDLHLQPAKKLETYHYLYEIFEDKPEIDNKQVEKVLRLAI